MKKLLLCLSVVTMALYAEAQDVIMLSSGRTIDAKVLSIGNSEISYKRADNLDGPVYTIPAANVFYIKYDDGRKEVINDLSQLSTTSDTSTSAMTRQANENAIRNEEKRISLMGKNNIRVRLGIGVQAGTWSPGASENSLSFIGGSLPELDVMWLHSIFGYTGNFGIGYGINNLVGSPDDDVDITATYFTLPIQLQYVADNGVTFAGILTPAVLASASGSYGNYEFEEDDFSDFRIGIGLEAGYNYRHWDFELRGTLWIGNVLAGLSSSIDYNLGLSVGYRFKLN